jgi:hypothetical protein
MCDWNVEHEGDARLRTAHVVADRDIETIMLVYGVQQACNKARVAGRV